MEWLCGREIMKAEQESEGEGTGSESVDRVSTLGVDSSGEATTARVGTARRLHLA